MSPVIAVLAAGWGLLASLAVVRAAGRRDTRHRAARIDGRGRSRVARSALGSRVTAVVRCVLAPFARTVTVLADRRARRADHDALARELPVAIDVLSVAVGAGCSPFLAIEVAAEWAPARVSGALGSVLHAHRLGVALDDALRDAGAQAEPLRPLTDTLREAGRLGVPIRPALSRLAHETRADLRRAAEVRARAVPVRLLFPLVFLVLPAFGLLTVAPALLAGLTGT